MVKMILETPNRTIRSGWLDMTKDEAAGTVANTDTALLCFHDEDERFTVVRKRVLNNSVVRVIERGSDDG